jgi:predicted heme/steroid binding protein/uncharacterized membrane protein
VSYAGESNLVDILFSVRDFFYFIKQEGILSMKEFDHESLSAFDGKDGKPIYIAYGEKVYDVSQSGLWEGGLHMNRHHAGRDLSSEFPAAPHDEEVFERYPQVGVLAKKTEPQRSMPALISSLIARFPFLERHPHPMTVHFPIVFLLAVAFFNVIYMLTGIDSLETTAFHCLIGGVMFLPVAMGTGLLAWWLNYLAKPMKPVVWKIVLSGILVVLSAGALFWRIANPGILDDSGPARIVYLAMTLSFVPLVSLIGYLGASLTFPIGKK